MITVWRTHAAIPAVFLTVFGAIEATFLSSAILKVPSGGWFSLMLAGIYGAVLGHKPRPHLDPKPHPVKRR